MDKKPVKVITGRAVQLTSHGMLGRKFDFNPGHTFLTKEWFYPGELNGDGDQVGILHDQWSFWTNTGGNLPLFFGVEDVQKVIIPSDSETVQIFKVAPFKVIIHDRQS